MYASPLPDARVTVALVTNVYTKAPLRALQGAGTVQSPPIVSTVLDVLATWNGAPPLSSVHTFGATHPKVFDPWGAVVLKNISPIEQVAGRLAPVRNGRTNDWFPKSTCFPCRPRSS